MKRNTLYNGQIVEAIDCTPTWEQVLPSMLLVLRDGNKEGQAAVKKEFIRMAKAADMFNEQNKSEEQEKAFASFSEWEEEVYQGMEVKGELTRSDAQGIAMIREDELRKWFAAKIPVNEAIDELLNPAKVN